MKDPIKTLPSEVLSPLFSTFNNRELARLSSISKLWRKQILTDKIIHRQLNLTNLKRELSEDETIELVARLAALSSYPKNEILLNLQPFWDSLEAAEPQPTYDQLMLGTSHKLESLFNTIISATNGKLAKLHLGGTTGFSENEFACSLAAAVVEGIFCLNGGMERLEMISLRIPLPISLDSGGENGSKRFMLKHKASRRKLRWDLPSLVGLLQKVVQFTGSGLKHFDFDLSNFSDGANNPEVLQQVFSEMEKSKSTLKQLSSSFVTPQQARAGLKSILKLDNLRDIYIGLHMRDDVDDQISFPSTSSSNSNLEKFEVSMKGARLDWLSPSLMEWIGTGLTSLYLHNELPSELPMDFIRQLLHRNPLLTEITIQGFGISASLGSSPLTISSPKLKIMSLHRIYGETELFSGVSLPSLQRLQFQPKGETVNLQDRFFSLLELCKTSLRDLTLSDYHIDLPELPAQVGSLELHGVETLKIFRGSINLERLSSYISFKSLKHLEIDRSALSIQDVARIAAQSASTLEKIALTGRERRRKGKGSEGLVGCSFPKLHSLLLRNQSGHMLSFFAQCKFENLQVLGFDHMNSVMRLHYPNEELSVEQVSFNSFLKILESGRSTLEDVSFVGFVKEGEVADPGLEFRVPIKFPELEIFNIKFQNEISPTLLNPLQGYRMPWIEKLGLALPLESSLSLRIHAHTVCQIIMAPFLYPVYSETTDEEYQVRSGPGWLEDTDENDE